MSSIQWTSSTLNSYFKTSLNQSDNSLYSCLSDAALIKSGTYSKLMKSYYAALSQKQDSETKETVDETAKKEETSSDKSEHISDSTVPNTTYNANALKNQTVSSLLDTLV